MQEISPGIEFEVLKYCQTREAICNGCNKCFNEIDFTEGGEQGMSEITIGNVPPEALSKVKSVISETLKSEFNASVSEETDEDTGDVELDLQLKDWEQKERKTIRERQIESQDVEKEKAELMSKARKFAMEYPDSELPSLVQCYDENRRFDYKMALALESFAEAQEKQKIVVNEFVQHIDTDSEIADEAEKLAKQVSDEQLPTIIKYADEGIKNFYRYQIALEELSKRRVKRG